ncbi:MAG TPA: hypothetical protein VM818_09195 [Vicinamibacterales bacterium]|nr:hypothetical protein [Vicinamibacterales bacterium]
MPSAPHAGVHCVCRGDCNAAVKVRSDYDKTFDFKPMFKNFPPKK